MRICSLRIILKAVNELFDQLKISKTPNYEKHLKKHNVIHLNVQQFFSKRNDIDEMITLITRLILKELKLTFPEVAFFDEQNLTMCLSDVYMFQKEKFVLVIDEWDCIFRSFKQKKEAQEKYLDFLRDLLKDQPYVELCYMTGILPVKKYGTHSALNMFDEISMIEPRSYSEFMGFTGTEVKALCEQYDVDFSMMQFWYNGYQLKDNVSIYSPRSVTAAIADHDFLNYWSQTETFEALKEYIDLNYEGLKDDVMTLLIHLGYLGYDAREQKVYIPNNEVNGTFITSIKTSN